MLRAREDAARTAAKLQEMGCEPLLSPVLEIAATGAAIPAGAYDAVLASSAKGVECAGPETHLLKSLSFHAVGAKTAAAAQAEGWRPDIVAGNAEAILPLLLDRYRAPAHFLYLAGRDRQAALEAGLRAGGHAITAVEVYEARAAERLSDEAIASMREGAVDIALHYSRRSAELFLNLAGAAFLTPHLARMAHVALSEDVARPLRAIGLNPAVAAKPDEAGLLAAARDALESAGLRAT